jgi:hypothetical protein
MKPFQIGVREFLVITALVAVILGWAWDHGGLVAERDELRMQVSALKSQNESQHDQIQWLQEKTIPATP